jgi:hypothetical protein
MGDTWKLAPVVTFQSESIIGIVVMIMMDV